MCIASVQAELTAAGEKVKRKAVRAAAASHIWLDWISAKELPAEALLQTVLATKSGASKVIGFVFQCGIVMLTVAVAPHSTHVFTSLAAQQRRNRSAHSNRITRNTKHACNVVLYVVGTNSSASLWSVC
jgi:hypothetical protein